MNLGISLLRAIESASGTNIDMGKRRSAEPGVPERLSGRRYPWIRRKDGLEYSMDESLTSEMEYLQKRHPHGFYRI